MSKHFLMMHRRNNVRAGKARAHVISENLLLRHPRACYRTKLHNG